MNPILNDLQSFYESLPHPGFKHFDRNQVEKSLHHLLTHVYGATRNKNLNSLQCKNLIGNEMNKLIEGKHLKSLSTAMGVFVEGVKDLLKPYIEEIEKAQESSIPFLKMKSPTAEQKKRDENYLKRRGPLEGYIAPYLGGMISDSALPILKRIIGLPAELGQVEPRPHLMKALNILLDHCESVEHKIYQGKKF